MKALIFVLATALAMPASAVAATQKKRVRGYAPQPQIACTYAGCLPVPRGCRPVPGKTWSGDPSGFDVMVCPNGTRYGHL